ncbi:MAG TPA: hypothetical protein VF696_01700 [Candidatus Paceibacterota bacterium]|jgi:TolA-binding protein
MKARPEKLPRIERFTSWVGSPASLVLHTLVFAGFFALVIFDVLALETMLLILTTVVSLEAIYLAIFIQMTVNMNTESLREVEEDIDEIQEDVEEMSEDLDELQEDVEEMSEDLEELHEDDEKEEQRDAAQAKSIDALANSVRQILDDLEALKRGK